MVANSVAVVRSIVLIAALALGACGGGGGGGASTPQPPPPPPPEVPDDPPEDEPPPEEDEPPPEEEPALTHTVSVVAGPGGTVSPASRDVEDGEDAEFVVTPDDGYALEAISGCDGELSSDQYFMPDWRYGMTGITADCTVTVSFIPIAVEPSNPLPYHGEIFDIAHGNGQFIATAGAILKSSDGLDWTVDTAIRATSVVHGDGAWVIGGVLGYALAHSQDGDTWHMADTTLVEDALSTHGFPESIMYGNGVFIASNPFGLLLNSTDGGMSWAELEPPAGVHDGGLRDGIYANGTYIFIGQDADTFEFRLYLTSDLENWETRDITGERISSIAYLNGTYVATATFSPTVFVSSDLVTWDDIVIDGGFLFATAGDNGFVVSGFNDSHEAVVYHSPDGTNWTKIEDGPWTWGLTRGAYGDGRYVLGGIGGELATSTNGTDWTGITQGIRTHMRAAVRFMDAQFIISDDRIYRSMDKGTTLVSVHDNAGLKFWAIDANDGVMHVVGEQGTILSSQDGENWNPVNSPVATDLWSVAYAGGSLLVGGEEGELYVTSDMNNWTTVTLEEAVVDGHWVHRLHHGSGAFFAATVGFPPMMGVPGFPGYLYRSDDGVTWTKVLDLDAALAGVLSSGDTVVAFAQSSLNRMAISMNGGIDWTLVDDLPGILFVPRTVLRHGDFWYVVTVGFEIMLVQIPDIQEITDAKVKVIEIFPSFGTIDAAMMDSDGLNLFGPWGLIMKPSHH